MGEPERVPEGVSEAVARARQAEAQRAVGNAAREAEQDAYGFMKGS